MPKIDYNLPPGLKILRNIISYPAKAIKIVNEINKLDKAGKNDARNPEIKNRRLWAKRFRKTLLASLSNENLTDVLMRTMRSFYLSRLICIKKFREEVPGSSVILVTAVKNSYSRLEHFLRHYRNIGVGHFIFIDNGSSDETINHILKQYDAACYQTDAQFSAANKAGWFNRIAAHYGTGRWYIIADSDELLVYPGMNRISIGQYAGAIQSKGYSCVKTVMLDVYPDGVLMDENMSDEEYLEACIYFDRGDRQGYAGSYIYDSKYNTVTGGMRERLFYEQTGVKLTKPTLINFAQVYMVCTHDVFPKKADLTAPYGGAVLHYKFLPSDRLRYRQIAREGCYHNASEMYKTVNSRLEETPDINAMSEYSVRFDDGSAWQYLPFIKDLTKESDSK